MQNCYLGDKEKALIKVCECKGSLEFVHQDCIDEWVNRTKKLLCLCGYRMTLQREKLQLTMYERYDKSMEEVVEELPVREYRKVLILATTCLCVSALIVLFGVCGWIFNGEKLMDLLYGLRSGGLVFWKIYFIDFLIFFSYLKLFVPQLLTKMRQDRYKLVVKAIELKNTTDQDHDRQRT